jgi:FG-GAP repeat
METHSEAQDKFQTAKRMLLLLRRTAAAVVLLLATGCPAVHFTKVSPQNEVGVEIGSFGWSVAFLGDIDGDLVGDLAVGAPDTLFGPNQLGTVWILMLTANGTVRQQQNLRSRPSGNFQASQFGLSLATIGDVDGMIASVSVSLLLLCQLTI